MRKNKIRILHVAQAAGGVDRYIRMLLKYHGLSQPDLDVPCVLEEVCLNIMMKYGLMVTRMIVYFGA